MGAEVFKIQAQAVLTVFDAFSGRPAEAGHIRLELSEGEAFSRGGGMFVVTGDTRPAGARVKSHAYQEVFVPGEELGTPDLPAVLWLCPGPCYPFPERTGWISIKEEDTGGAGRGEEKTGAKTGAKERRLCAIPLDREAMKLTADAPKGGVSLSLYDSQSAFLDGRACALWDAEYLKLCFGEENAGGGEEGQSGREPERIPPAELVKVAGFCRETGLCSLSAPLKGERRRVRTSLSPVFWEVFRENGQRRIPVLAPAGNESLWAVAWEDGEIAGFVRAQAGKTAELLLPPEKEKKAAPKGRKGKRTEGK